MKLPLAPRTIALLLLVIIVFLTLASIAGQVSLYYLAGDPLRSLRIFDLDDEYSVSSFYASAGLLLSWILLGIIAYDKRKKKAPYARHWTALWIVFLFLFLDEIVGIHDKFTEPLREVLGAGGFLYYTWVIPGAILVAVFALSFLRFTLNLPKDTRRWFLISGAVFLAGALGVEVLGGAHFEAHGQDMVFALLASAEEFLEMLGIVIFIYALASYVENYLPPSVEA